MKKITVKHYLNKKLKANRDGLYPVYVRVIFNRQNTNFRSEILTAPSHSDDSLEKSLKAKREIEYETQIITAIINFGIEKLGENFSILNISSVIAQWKLDLLDFYFDEYLSHKVISNELISFVVSKTGIDEPTTTAIVGHVDLEIHDLEVLSQLDIFNSKIKESISYAHLLSQFSELHYPSPSWKYGADNTFNFFEWTVRGGKSKFLTYASSKNLMPERLIIQKTLEFDNYLTDRQYNEIEFWKNFRTT